MQTTELFKTFQDVIVPERPAVLCSMHIVEDCSGSRSITLFRYSPTEYAGFRITTFRPPNDEPCRQSCAARGRPRLSYRERHWIAPVRLAAAQSSPWLWPATYRPSRIDTTNHAEPPDKGHPEKTQTKSKTNKRITPPQDDGAKEE